MTDPAAPNPPSPDPAPAPRRRPRRRHRWWRRTKWTVRLTVGIPLLLLTLGLLLMRSPLVGRAVGAEVQKATGGRWRADHAAVMLNGQIIVTDLALRVPGIDGPGGELLTARQAVIDVDWWQLAPLKWVSSRPPGPVVRAVRLAEPAFRLSQSTDDDTLNIGLLAAAPGSGAPALPRIDVIDGRIEFTEHAASGRFEELAVIPIAGALMPSGDAPSVFAVRLQEIGRAPSVSGERRGMVLDGRVNLATGEASLKLLNISLDAWPAESVPSRFRDLWRQLAVQGAVRQTVFAYTKADGLNVAVTLDDVALTAPVPAEGPGDDDGYLSLAKVDGSISLSAAGLTADLTGVIEQQPGRSQVHLRTRGLGFDSGFRCEIVGREMSVAREPRFLPYVPDVVREYLNMFGGPTAVIDAKVVLERADPVNGQASPVTVPEGRMTLRNGRAAFHRFPYPFHDLTGEVTFDDQTIRIVRIEGAGHAGARLSASALISPLTHDAMADVKVDVENVIVDDELLRAMPPGHRRLLEVLFARERYDQLLAAGLVRDPAHAAAETGRHGADPGAVPEFEFGGRADVTVHVHRPRGEHQPWDTRVGVRFDKAGILPEPFPFPIVARDLAIQINNKHAELTGGRFTGLHGGVADVAASVGFGQTEAQGVDPDVRISARAVPVDELLINAVPGAEPDHAPADGQPTAPLGAKQILRRLDLRGQVDCSVTLRPAEHSEPAPAIVGPSPLPAVGYEIEVGLGDLTAAPAAVLTGGADSGLCIREIDGSLIVTDREVRIDGLRAVLGRLTPDTPATDTFAHTQPAGAITLRLLAEVLPAASAEQGRLHAEVQLESLDLRDPFEPAVRVFSSEAADVFESARRDRLPRGIVNATVSLDAPRAPPGGSMTVGVQVLSAADLAVKAFGGDLRLDDLAGAVRVTTRARNDAAAGERFVFEGVSARLAFNGAPAGRFDAAGGLTLDAATGAIAAGHDITCDLRDWRFEGGLTQALLARFGGDAASEGYQAFAPQGQFNASLAVSGAGDDMTIQGQLRPRSLQIVRHAQPVNFLVVDGAIGFHTRLGPGSILAGDIEDARAVTEEWSAAGRGRWAYHPATDARPASVRITAEFGGQVRHFGPELRSVLPENVNRALDKLTLAADEPILFDNWRIDADLGAARAEADDRISFEGDIAFTDISADVGLKIADAAGRVRVRAVDPGPGDGATPDPSLEIRLSGPRLRLAGIELTDYQVDIQRTSDLEMAITRAHALCHGGRILASGTASYPPSPPGDDSPGPPATLRFNALMAGVNFAPLLADLGADPASTAAPTSSTDATRGTVDARIALTAVEGDPNSRIGRGAIRIARGDVLRLPLILPLMQVSNLILPIGDRLDYLQATFHLHGRRAVFDDISVLSNSIAIVGGGSITLPALDLDMRFNTRSNTRIPIWSDLFEAVRNEIASTTVTGTVERPVIRSEPLTGTRRMLGGMIAPGESQDPRGPATAARRERARVRAEGG